MSKDELASWDPAITEIFITNGNGEKYVNLGLAYNTSVLNFTKKELETLIKILEKE